LQRIVHHNANYDMHKRSPYYTIIFLDILFGWVLFRFPAWIGDDRLTWADIMKKVDHSFWTN